MCPKKIISKKRRNSTEIIGGERFTNHFQLDVGVSKNRGTSKWMVKIMENPIKMDDLGGFNPLFSVAHPCSHKNVLLEPVKKRFLKSENFVERSNTSPSLRCLYHYHPLSIMCIHFYIDIHIYIHRQSIYIIMRSTYVAFLVFELTHPKKNPTIRLPASEVNSIWAYLRVPRHG